MYAFVQTRLPVPTAELPKAGAAPARDPPWECSPGAGWGLALFPARPPPPPWLPHRIPEHVVMGIDVQALAGTIQNASVPHHGTPNALGKWLPGGGQQLGALGAIQEAQGGADVCGCQRRQGAVTGLSRGSGLSRDCPAHHPPEA